MKPIALCVGHSRQINGKTEGGAVSFGGVSEHAYNKELADLILADLGRDVGVALWNRYEGNGYGAAISWLSGEIKKKDAVLAIELHFNCATGDARGAEWLYWHSSTKGKELASCIHSAFTKELPEIKDRGIKPRSSGDRGSDFLRATHCPAVICEPFFGDNKEDWRIAVTNKKEIAAAIANGIRSYLKIVK